MAGDWIKMRSDLFEHPKVFKLADLLGVDEFAAVGMLFCFWAWADKHAVDGRVDAATTRLVDKCAHRAGFAEALVSIGWLVVDADGITIPRFNEHNGDTAKERTLKNQRQARWRAGKRDDDVDDEPSTRAATKASTREEKRREEKYPPTPLDEIVELYHAKLPDLPRVVLKTEKRTKACREFWRWIFDSRKSDGNPRASTADQALTWVAGYFDRAAHNDFLMGKRPTKGHENWRADFDFLLTEKGRTHVIERTVEA